MVIMLEEWEKEAIAEAQVECDRNNPVVQKITYHRFVSKSKGRRNGKKRVRRYWKEVHLVRYQGGFQSWHLFPFDEYATEIIGQHADDEILREAIIERWGY